MPEILVACIGNIFLGDDGFGVEVARRFRDRVLPEGVRVMDFGIRSYDLAYAIMEAWDLVILVDAVPRGGHPGTLYLIEPELPADSMSPAVDAHAMNPESVLRLVQALGGRIPRLYLLGCEPSAVGDEESAMQLSEPVRRAVEEALRMIEELIASLPVPAGTKEPVCGKLLP